MSEQTPETQAEQSVPPPGDTHNSARSEQDIRAIGSRNQVAIAAIVAVTVIALCCIVSCTIVLYAFFDNAPW